VLHEAGVEWYNDQLETFNLGRLRVMTKEERVVEVLRIVRRFRVGRFIGKKAFVGNR
jgi:hypothetical protein